MLRAASRWWQKIKVMQTLRTFKLSLTVPLPKIIQIEPTNRCNFRCRFCSNSMGNRKTEIQDITTTKLRSILSSLPELKYVNLQGLGEPFLHPRLELILEEFKNRGIKITSTSNGSLLTKQNIRNLVHDYIVDLSISIDSHRADLSYELRPGMNLDRIIKGVQLLLKERNEGRSNFLFGFNVTLSNMNYKDLEGIGNLAVKLGIDYILIVGLKIWYIPGEPNYDLARQAIKEQLLYRHKISNIITKMQTKLLTKGIIVKYIKTKRSLGNCSFPFSTMFISANGTVTPCNIRMHPQYHGLFTIHSNSSLAKQWNGKAYKSLRKAHLEKDTTNIMCGKCFS